MSVSKAKIVILEATLAHHSPEQPAADCAMVGRAEIVPLEAVRDRSAVLLMPEQLRRRGSSTQKHFDGRFLVQSSGQPSRPLAARTDVRRFLNEITWELITRGLLQHHQ